MTHSPPVPPANQTTFPRQEPPAPVELPPIMRGVTNAPSSNNIGLLVGFGAAAAVSGLVTGFLLFRRPEPPAKPAKAKGKGAKAKQPKKAKAAG